MTPADELLSWQRASDLSHVEAARELDVPVQTYRNWIHGRRTVPGAILRSVRNIELLRRYIERYGPLEDMAAE